MREIVFDTETTGLSPQNGERIFEIGMIELINRVPTGRKIWHFVNPEKELSAASTRITGVENHQLLDKPVFKDIVHELIEFIGEDAALVAHNANFDMSFLNFELELCGCKPVKNQVIDTLALAKKALPGARHSLDALCKRFNVEMHAEREVHGALLDAQLLVEVYIELTGGLQSALSLENTKETEAYTGISARLTREPIVPSPHPLEVENAGFWRKKLPA